VEVAAQGMAHAIDRFAFAFQDFNQLIHKARPAFGRRIARIGSDRVNE
jgi:hypothetical protein